MASNADQFADLELSKEDREQIFEDPHEGAQSHTPQNGSRWVSTFFFISFFFVYFFLPARNSSYASNVPYPYFLTYFFFNTLPYLKFSFCDSYFFIFYYYCSPNSLSSLYHYSCYFSYILNFFLLHRFARQISSLICCWSC